MSEFTAPSVRELLDNAAEKYGDATFIKYLKNGEVVEKSFATVRSDSLALCRKLRHLSDKKLHIAITGKTNYEYLVWLTAVLTSGNVAVPFAPAISAKEAKMLFDRADIDMVFYGNEFADKADDVKAACPRITEMFNIDSEEFLAECVSEYSEDSEYAHLSDYAVDKNDCAVIIFTSGTTGVKKGVMLSMNALVGNIMYHDYCTDIFRPNDVSLSVLPMYHCFCFSGDYIKNLKDGVQVCLCGSTMELLKNLSTFEPRVMRVVPMIASSLLNRIKAIIARNPGIDPREAAKQVYGKNIKWLISGGAYLDPELSVKYDKLGILLRQGYGMTEAGCRISVPDEGVSRESVGRVTDICKVRIQDGEIQVNTPTMMMGYYKMPEETAAMFTEDGWLKTGDIGHLTEDNQLFITGRVKNLIILSSGENVSPEAIEKKFAPYDEVHEAMVFQDNDRLSVEIYPNPEYSEGKTLEELQKTFEDIVDNMNRTSKASHIISNVIIRSKALPRTESGKLLRKSIII